MANLMLADDHALLREMIAGYLSDRGGHDVATVASVDEACDLLDGGARFDLVLVDYRMPGANGMTGISEIVARAGEVPVALLSGVSGVEVAREALNAGLRGYLPKTLTPEELATAVGRLLEGDRFLPDGFSMSPEDDLLTRRETEVLRGISQGLSNKEIARELDLKEVTIKLHVKTLCRKLEARNRTHAAMRALDLGLL